MTRRAVWSPPLEQVAPKDGHSLVLTVDVAIQQLVERTLEKTVARFEAESAIGLVTDPRTGEILAMASWPPFDPNEPAASPAALRRNRAVTDPAEPGSAFKVSLRLPVSLGSNGVRWTGPPAQAPRAGERATCP